MIGFLSGILKFIEKNTIILDVNGVGYEVNCLKLTSNVGEKMDLFVHTYVREDQMTLFGFENQEQLNLFKTLISVKGIGPKVAQNILGNLEIAEIYSSIANEDAELLCMVPGIGKKGAQRLILEMHSKIKDSLISLKNKKIGKDGYRLEREALQALLSLGFETRQANEMIKGININNSDKVEDIIKMALSQK